MGCFDSLYFEFLPEEYQQGGLQGKGEYQTYDIGCAMRSFVIDKEGTLHREEWSGGTRRLVCCDSVTAAFNCESARYDRDGAVKWAAKLQGIICEGRLLVLLHGRKVLFLHPRFIDAVRTAKQVIE